MVCAPTNKAVSVLATRFMASFRENKHGSFSAIIVGDADKLLTDERSLGNSSDKGCKTQAGNLKSIFLYTWMQTLVEDYRTIKSCFLPGYKGGNSLENLCSLSAKLERRLSNSLPNLCTKIHKAAEEISAILRKLKPGTGGHDIVTKLEKLIKDLAAIPNDIVWSQVLSFADVIFCTLSSAGGAALKRTGQIDDLIIDEAAAATEPEICVPFHLKPNRLFAVGDPLQLPATVLSQRATQLGLTKSLHERLMYECNFGHVMLKVQYRMNPEISKFPSMRFYKSEIANGDNVMNSKYQMGPKLLNRLPYTFLQVSGLEEQGATGSYHNRAEATKVVELVSDLRRMTASSNPLWHSSERVRVITFYQSQVSLIKRLLINKGFGDKIVVATVDSSQGCEADIVIISFVRSQRDDCKSHSVGFLADNRRMNVALTRAKYQLICIGNICSFAKMYGAQTMQMLAANADERRLVQPALQVVACSRENRG